MTIMMTAATQPLSGLAQPEWQAASDSKSERPGPAGGALATVATAFTAAALASAFTAASGLVVSGRSETVARPGSYTDHSIGWSP